MKPLTYVSPADFAKLVGSKSSDEEIVKLVANHALIKSAPLVDIKAVNRVNRTIDFVISDASVDRDNDTIAVGGWDISNYINNPVVLFVHDHWQPPVARGIEIGVRGDQLVSTAEFTPKDLYSFGDMIFEFYAQGFMRATSVGFKPKEWKYNDDRKYGVDYLGQELLEYSCVPVPSNPTALMDAKSKGIDLKPLRTWAERYMDEPAMLKSAGSQRETFEKLRALTIEGKSFYLFLEGMKSVCSCEVKETEPEVKKEKSVKIIESWGCKLFVNATKTPEHVHASEEEAKSCEFRNDVLSTILPVLAASAKIDLKVDSKESRDLKEKAGRVLSAKNENKLRQAMAKGDETAILIREVLDQLESEEDAEDDKSVSTKAEDDPDFFQFEKDPDDLEIEEATISEAIASAFGDELRSQINAVTGRVD
jgi:hypothetical protein